MNKPPTLTLAFLTHAPDSAAEVLEGLDAAEAAAFIDEIPARLAARTVGRMSSWAAARCLEQVAAHQAAAVLRGLPFHDAVGLLRLIDRHHHAGLYAELPTARARRLQNALTYPPGSIGAWIDPDVPSFAGDATAGDAARYLRQSDGVSHVFMHDVDSGQFAGAVSTINVMRRHSGTRLFELQATPVRPLSSRASLASAAGHDGWDEFLVLPVVGRAKALVGGLSRVSLRKGLATAKSSRQVATRSVAGQIVVAFGITCNGLMQLLSPARGAKGRQRDG